MTESGKFKQGQMVFFNETFGVSSGLFYGYRKYTNDEIAGVLIIEPNKESTNNIRIIDFSTSDIFASIDELHEHNMGVEEKVNKKREEFRKEYDYDGNKLIQLFLNALDVDANWDHLADVIGALEVLLPQDTEEEKIIKEALSRESGEYFDHIEELHQR